MFFKKQMRNGLTGRLMRRGLSYGLASFVAETNYRGGDFADMVRGFTQIPEPMAQNATCAWLEHGVGSLDDLLAYLFGPNTAAVLRTVQELEAGARLVHQMRTGRPT